MIRRLLIALHLVIGVSALGAGQALTRDPSGRTLGFEVAWLRGSPFRDYRVPGLFLMLVISGANLKSAFAQWRRWRVAPLASMATGALLVTWVAIQTAIIGLRHPSQGIWLVVFPLVAILGLVEQTQRAPARTGD
ncbi:MAG: hypothetical protein IT299_13300 [Dehalococcoidia bacterium]|nr:hypothetical protein [Dehalococcoidia bacterium]